MSLAAISDKATDTSTLLALAADETNMQLDAGATNEREDHKKGKGGSYGVSMVMVDADERVRVSYNTKRGVMFEMLFHQSLLPCDCQYLSRQSKLIEKANRFIDGI